MNTETLPPAVLNGKHMVTLDERQDYGLPMPIQVDRIVERVEAVKEIVTKVFKDDLHFGKIPGTGDKKTLLKPGFDALCLAFQFAPEFIKQPESIERDNFINLVYKCRIIHSASGRVIATGDGSCNSKEEKYRWTTSARKCPACQKETIIKGKAEYGGGWLCYEKKGGCKAKFQEGDPAIEAQPVGRVENDNPWNFHNTLTKMAQKRAGMAAIITACGLSGDFTQDMEDFTPQGAPPDFQTVNIPGSYTPPGWNEAHDPRPFGESQQPAAPAPVEEFGSFSREAPQDVPPATFEETVPPPPPHVNKDVVAAYLDVAKELGHCKNKEHFVKLKELMQSSGVNYVHPCITNLVNSRYLQLFPRQPKTETKGGK